MEGLRREKGKEGCSSRAFCVALQHSSPSVDCANRTIDAHGKSVAGLCLTTEATHLARRDSYLLGRDRYQSGISLFTLWFAIDIFEQSSRWQTAVMLDQR